MRLLWAALFFALLVATVAAQDQPIYVLALPVVRQAAATRTPAPISTIAPPPSRTSVATATQTNTPIPTTGPIVTVTPTDNPSDNDPSLGIGADDDDPVVGQNFVLSGSVTDSNGDGISGVQVVVTYTYEGIGNNAWCTVNTSGSDGDWKCTVTVPVDFKDKDVTWTGTIVVAGRKVQEEYEFDFSE